MDKENAIQLKSNETKAIVLKKEQAVDEKAIVKATHLQKNFGKKEVLKDINLKINKGERVAIIGSNGSGKSTLINILLGLLKENKGTLDFPYHNSLKEFRKNTGIQFQESIFPLNYKVKDIIFLVAEQKENYSLKEYKKWKEEKTKEIDFLVDIFELKKVLKQKVNSLSGGEKQRLNVLLAILNKPQVLILDEISTGLDIKAQEALINFIGNYCEQNGTTLIIISHIIFEIETLTNKILLLEEGIIKFEISIENLQTKFGTLANALKSYFIQGKDLI